MNVAAVDAATGEWKWVRKAAQPAALRSAGFLANDVYFVQSLDGRVRAYRASDGETVWTSEEHGSIGSSLIVADGRLLFGTGIPEDFAGNCKGMGLVGYRVASAQPVEASAPRNHTLYCPVGKRREEGMKGTLVVCAQ